ncbi:MAG: YlxR family protein [Clostridiales bacterium]|nr:YlxR family protein [Clostridiales bacterium]
MRRRKIPLRMCLGCNEMRPKKELIRVVRSPEGDLSIDKVGKKPGRGAYICMNPNCLESALRNKRLERAFGQKIPHDIHESLTIQLGEGENN